MSRASLNALDSVRGINMARWRPLYNAICPPVLTYGCQLWYRQQKKLAHKLQVVVQNEGIHLISGAFRTAPRDPLHDSEIHFSID